MSSVELTPKYELCPSDLQWPVESVSEDFTLLDLFQIIHLAQQDCPQLPEMLGMAYFDAFYEEATREPKPDDGLHYLELYWHIDYDTIKTKEKGGKRAIYQDCAIRGDLPNLMGFHGIGEHQCAFEGSCPNGCPEDDGYAIEMTPVNELVHLPIRMNPEVGMYEPWIKDADPLSRTGFTLTIHPTLYTFITSIFWELTFLGHPSNRDEQMEEIQQSMDDIKSGKVKLIPFDDLLDNLDDDEDDKSDGDS